MSSTKLHFCPIRYAKACVMSPEKSCLATQTSPPNPVILSIFSV